MQQEHCQAETVFLETQIIEANGVCFDPDTITLQGCYADELSAYRAKKLWIEAFENNFLLEYPTDFSITVTNDFERHLFFLTCSFVSACARYAFWRLTNHQAPEVQYVIETAHIPFCESRHEDILRAPDMRSVSSSSGLPPDQFELRYPHHKPLASRIAEILSKLSW